MSMAITIFEDDFQMTKYFLCDFFITREKMYLRLMYLNILHFLVHFDKVKWVLFLLVSHSILSHLVCTDQCTKPAFISIFQALYVLYTVVKWQRNKTEVITKLSEPWFVAADHSIIARHYTLITWIISAILILQ